MAYKLYMAGTLMPITPSKVTVKINNQNKTMTLINGEEINILKAAGLSDPRRVRRTGNRNRVLLFQSQSGKPD